MVTNNVDSKLASWEVVKIKMTKKQTNETNITW